MCGNHSVRQSKSIIDESTDCCNLVNGFCEVVIKVMCDANVDISACTHREMYQLQCIFSLVWLFYCVDLTAEGCHIHLRTFSFFMAYT